MPYFPQLVAGGRAFLGRLADLPPDGDPRIADRLNKNFEFARARMLEEDAVIVLGGGGL